MVAETKEAVEFEGKESILRILEVQDFKYS
jgi:hypothetical protein